MDSVMGYPGITGSSECKLAQGLKGEDVVHVPE